MFMFNQFRIHYPKGSLITELAAIDHGQYIVRCLVQVDGTTLVTGLAAAQTIEVAEDQARSRALAVLGIDLTTTPAETKTSLPNPDAAPPLPAVPIAPTITPSERLLETQADRFSPTPIATDVKSFSSFEPICEEEVSERAVPTSRIGNEMTFNEVSFIDEPTTDKTSTEVPTSPEVESPLWMTQPELPEPQLNDAVAPSSVKSSTRKKQQSKQQEVDPKPVTPPDTPVDFSDIIARTNVELKRLGWTTQQGKEYLLQTYGKRSRQLLTDGELLDFLHHLESVPTPE